MKRKSYYFLFVLYILMLGFILYGGNRLHQ